MLATLASITIYSLVHVHRIVFSLICSTLMHSNVKQGILVAQGWSLLLQCCQEKTPSKECDRHSGRQGYDEVLQDLQGRIVMWKQHQSTCSTLYKSSLDWLTCMIQDGRLLTALCLPAAARKNGIDSAVTFPGSVTSSRSAMASRPRFSAVDSSLDCSICSRQLMFCKTAMVSELQAGVQSLISPVRVSSQLYQLLIAVQTSL